MDRRGTPSPVPWSERGVPTTAELRAEVGRWAPVTGALGSCKLAASGWRTDRTLLTVDAPAEAGRLADLARRLGLSGPEADEVEAGRSGAAAVHVGTDRTAAALRVKVYLEHPPVPGTADGVGHVAFKWVVGAPGTLRVDRYRRRPLGAAGGALAGVAAVLGPSAPAARAFAAAVVELDPQAGADPDWGLLVVEDAASRRRSFDLRTSLGPRALLVDDLDGALTEVERAVAGTSGGSGQGWWTSAHPASTVVRVAGGLDADGGEFVTVYFGRPRPRSGLRLPG